MMAKIAGVALIVLGLAALVYGGFSYKGTTHDAELGPLRFEIEERERVHIPPWAGALAVLAGTAVLLLQGRRKA